MKQVNDHASMNLFVAEHQDATSLYAKTIFSNNKLNPLTFDYTGATKTIDPSDRCHKPAFFQV